MTHSFKPLGIGLAVAAGMTAAAISGHAQNATATISGVAVSGGYDYTITLDNTGTLALNSFWYGWTYGGNNLASAPASAANSLGWGNSVNAYYGYSIQWANSTGSALAPGNTATFTFFDASTPTGITTTPSGESVAYVNGIDGSQGASGDSTGVFSPTLIAAPEPSAGAVAGLGAVALWLWRRRK